MMMSLRSTAGLIIGLILILWPTLSFSQHTVRDNVVVVTSVHSPNFGLQQIKKTYLGMNVSSRTNDRLAVTLPLDSHTRRLFHTKVIGLSEARVRTFWAQMLFSGRGNSPLELQNPAQIIQYLIKHPGSLGYLPSNHYVPRQLKIIYSSQAH